jgi:predicted flap endonuclease-1-like 5' DNA nuclease
LGKVKGLGGKLGALLQGLGAETCGQVAALTNSQLAQHIPDKAR